MMRPLVLQVKPNEMKSKSRKPVMHKAYEGQTMKLRVDNKTTIVVRTQKALEMWMERYPQAQVVA
jgi:frataxin-like iron-binding protein CyaY